MRSAQHRTFTRPIPEDVLRPTRPRTIIAVGALAALTTVGLTAVSNTATAAPSSGAVVSEVYGARGNSGATLKNDFIELANRSVAVLAVDGWSVQYISAAPGATTTWSVTPITGWIAAGSLYLIGEAAGAAGTADLPPTQATGTSNVSGTAGTVALVNSTTALTCKTAADCAADARVIDLVGYGTALIHEGAADAAATANTTSAQRSAAADTDNNGTDFTADPPTPGATNAGTGGGGTGEPGPLRIHDIQGATWISPQNGQQVGNVPASLPARAPAARARVSGCRTRPRTLTRPPVKACSSSPRWPRPSPPATAFSCRAR